MINEVLEWSRITTVPIALESSFEGNGSIRGRLELTGRVDGMVACRGCPEAS